MKASVVALRLNMPTFIVEKAKVVNGQAGVEEPAGYTAILKIEMALRGLRQALRWTQEELPNSLNLKQAAIHRIPQHPMFAEKTGTKSGTK